MSYYSDNASTLIERYNDINSEKLHSPWLEHLPEEPGVACDIGAGTGRDANWLAKKGWDVVAVEPERKFRESGKSNCHAGVVWLDDKMPELHRLRELNQRFNLILLSAVWMHLPEKKRARAFRILSELLLPGGVLVISLRHSSSEEELKSRSHYPVSVAELEQYAKDRAVVIKSVTAQKDGQGRDFVSWQTVVMELPDDGSGSLPLLRHIIVNDGKASTYKLGLLRTLLRIADGAPGMVLRQTDDYVEIPFGLVGLYWIKLYMPLVLQKGLIQSPTHKPEENRGLGFATSSGFYKLAKLSPFDLRVGSTFDPQWAPIVIRSIREACANIHAMPAHFITYPGQDRKVFDCFKASVRYQQGSHWRIDKENLSAFGVFRVPLTLWQCLVQFACWVEPAILNEWVSLMNSYNAQYKLSVYDTAFQWEDSKRNTSQARKIASKVQKKLSRRQESLVCSWSGKRLIGNVFDIDHCFPWSRWLNNDLWNLLPANRQVNSQKSEKLPSAWIMHESRERILNWWQEAYAENGVKEQFEIEAGSALPLLRDGDVTFEAVYDAVLHQRTRLRSDQQLVEWQFKTR